MPSDMTILIIDDEETQLKSLESFLKRREFQTFTAGDGESGFEIARKNTIDLVLSDYRMPGWNGLVVLRKIKELNPEIDVVIMTAYGSIEDAVEIMKAGAYDYLTKPIDLDELENLINRIKEKRLLLRENKLLKEQLQEKFKFEAIISQSGEMEEVLNTAGRVATSKASVLIRGESGTGKELIARAIHFTSERKNKPFVVVNVAALAENLIESELFGHEKGAFTGASQKRTGRFEQADGGTLFIDEVGDIPLPVQVKLLRAIQFGEIERVGGTTPIHVDVRIIAATHRNLEEDLPVLIDHFIGKYSEANQKKVSGISSEARDRLMKYDFPGNVRELENIIERAVIMARGEYIAVADLPQQANIFSEAGLLDPAQLKDGHEAKMKAFEKEMILKALEESKGNQSAAARLLGITERHLRSRLEKLGLK
ncbi:MAG: sigma-54 dependent transcriptional regulator [Calditrichota bacterium]